MELKNIYEKDIYRKINPAVTVSDKQGKTVEAEIKEYVFTNELIEKLYYILDTVLNKNEIKTGIWINGYYGSGKSHYIKYVHYLLHRETSDTAFEYFEKAVKNYDTSSPGSHDNITQNNVRLLKNRVIGSNCDNILFNVEEETDDGNKGRLTRIFMNMFNKFRGFNYDNIPLALFLEKPLKEAGKLEDFKKDIEDQLGFDWNVDADNVASFQLQDVLNIAKKHYSFDTDSLYARLINKETYKVSINSTLIPELKSYLKDKDKNYRLLFLVDEVSQYIGNNKELLLNFQSIIERISEDLNNQVWIACTAQQSLDEVGSGIDGVDHLQDEFGKILGRFDTRISLQSNDASFITQRRVLDKNSVGLEVLNNMYDENKDYIENQFKINHDLFNGYRSTEEFILCYPFVPYQFKLIAYVFEAFQQLKFVIKEVKDNERSVLGITHYTAKDFSNQEVGGFIPFDAFFNKLFEQNLTNRGAKAIENALELSYVKNNEFAERVVKVLFMISNLLENQRQTFPSNIDNIAVLLMDKLDQNKMQLQKEIQKVLDKLIEENIIREEKGSYFFFNEDEIDVQNLIKNQSITLDERLKNFDELIRGLLGIRQKVKFGQNDFKVGFNIEGKEFLRNGDFDIKVLLTDSTPLSKKALEVKYNELIVCLNEWFKNDSSFQNDFSWFCKTNKYFINQSASSTGERSKTNANFRERNEELRKKMLKILQQRLMDVKYLSQNQVIEPRHISGNEPSVRMTNMINKHLEGIYKYHNLSKDYAVNQADLKRSAVDKQIPTETLTNAELKVNEFISANNDQINVQDLINEFAKAPFGWRFESVLDVCLHLVKKKKREFIYRGQPRYPIVNFINKAVSTSERLSCEIVKGEEIDQNMLDDVVLAYKEIFNENLTSANDKNSLYDNLTSGLNGQLAKYQLLEQDFFGKYPFGRVFNDATKKLSSWEQTRDIKKLFGTIINEQEEGKKLFDNAKDIEEFSKRALQEYKNIKSFAREENENVKMLDASEIQKMAKINEFLKLEDPRKELRHINKAYKELQNSLKEKIKELKQKVKNEYNDVFNELEAEAKKRGVDNTVYQDKEYTLNGIENINSLQTLKNKYLSRYEFKSKQLGKIIEATKGESKEPEAYFISNQATTIENEEELDIYLKKVREDMLKLINQDKTIILK